MPSNNARSDGGILVCPLIIRTTDDDGYGYALHYPAECTLFGDGSTKENALFFSGSATTTAAAPFSLQNLRRNARILLASVATAGHLAEVSHGFFYVGIAKT